MKGIVSKWKFFIGIVILTIITLLLYPATGKQSISFAGINFINFIFLLTPIFICIGLLDTWVERKTMIKIIGEKSGIRGVIVAFLLGVVTAVPLYALLPVAGMMLKKGSKISNVLIFICSCASIRIPLILFEVFIVRMEVYSDTIRSKYICGFGNSLHNQ